MPGGQREEFEDYEPGPIQFGPGPNASAPAAEPAAPLLPAEAMVSFEPDELPPPPSLKAIKQALKRAEPPPPPEQKKTKAAPAKPPQPAPEPPPAPAHEPLYAKDLSPLAPPAEPRVPPHLRNRAAAPIHSDHPAMAPLPTAPVGAAKPELSPSAPSPARAHQSLRELLIPPTPAPLARSQAPTVVQAHAVEVLDDEPLVIPVPPSKAPLISVPAAIIIGCLAGVILGGVIALAMLPRSPPPPAPPIAVVQTPPQTAANAPVAAAPVKAAPARKARGKAEYSKPVDTVAEPKLLPLRKVAPTDKVRRLDLDRLASDIQPPEEQAR